jgi:hypothetical protein
MAVSFLRLPHELLREIFIYLDFRQLLKASLVCEPTLQPVLITQMTVARFVNPSTSSSTALWNCDI